MLCGGFLSFAEQPYELWQHCKFQQCQCFAAYKNREKEFINIIKKCRSKVVDRFACAFTDIYVYTSTTLILKDNMKTFLS